METKTSPEANKTNHFNLGADLASEMAHGNGDYRRKYLEQRTIIKGTRTCKSRSPTAAHHMAGRSLILEQETVLV